MLHPAALGVRPQYIADYLELIGTACPLERVIMCCHGLELDANVQVKPRITLVKGRDMLDGINQQVPPYPMRPELNGWLHVCAHECVAREVPTLGGRSKAAPIVWSGSQPQWMPENDPKDEQTTNSTKTTTKSRRTKKPKTK
jgi:hypothetical protein